MAAIHDLIEDWIQIRSVLQRQLRLLETDQTRKGAQAADVASEADHGAPETMPRRDERAAEATCRIGPDLNGRRPQGDGRCSKA